MDEASKIELQRCERDGYLLIEVERESVLTYGPRKFKEWEIYRINSDGSHTLVGTESSEQFVNITLDCLNNKQWPSKSDQNS